VRRPSVGGLAWLLAASYLPARLLVNRAIAGRFDVSPELLALAVGVPVVELLLLLPFRRFLSRESA
jgi:hypothetical protein